MRTLQERYIAALTSLGAKVVPGKTRRYTTLARPLGGFYFVGKAGAVRRGDSVKASIPCSAPFKKSLLSYPSTAP